MNNRRPGLLTALLARTTKWCPPHDARQPTPFLSVSIVMVLESLDPRRTHPNCIYRDPSIRVRVLAATSPEKCVAFAAPKLWVLTESISIPCLDRASSWVRCIVLYEDLQMMIAVQCFVDHILRAEYQLDG